LGSATNRHDTLKILEVAVVASSSSEGGFHEFLQDCVEAVLFEESIELPARQAKAVLLLVRCGLQQLVSIAHVTAAETTFQVLCSVEQR
jgi:hypothetical protein